MRETLSRKNMIMMQYYVNHLLFCRMVDVGTACLYGKIEGEITMAQPEGFEE